MNVLIIGIGTVGSNLAKELAVLKPHLYDKYKGIDARQDGIRYDAAFVCVDSPMTCDSTCDLSEVRSAIRENDADVFVIKSTVLPGLRRSWRRRPERASSSARSITAAHSTATTSASRLRSLAGRRKPV